jgi:signal transduction histidine kinase
VQESLTNVVKHARASAVSVAVEFDRRWRGGDGRVSDDGTGFDAGLPTSGFGLAGLRERVFLAGGQLELTSTSRGTRVTARLPVSAEPAG